MSASLVICTEAEADIGLGHFMRCLALAEAWQEAEGSVLFLMPSPPTSVVKILMQKCMALQSVSPEFEPHEIGSATQQAKSEWLVLDSYRIPPQRHQAYQAKGLKLLWLDDNGSPEPISAELILNPHLYAQASLYPAVQDLDRLLLGPDYLLFRREFRRFDWPCFNPRARPSGFQISLFMGGTDPTQANILLLSLLSSWFSEHPGSELRVRVITTALNPQLSTLQSQIQQMPFPCQLVIEPANLIELLQESHLTITTPSGSAWELLQLKARLASLTVADNQMALAESLAQKGSVTSLGDIRLTAQTEIFVRLKQVLAQSHTAAPPRKPPALNLDGQGVERILQKMGVTPFRLRPLRFEDARIYWEMSNDPLVRAMSFHSDPIPWESHLTWLLSKLAQTQHFFLMVLDEREVPVGVLRFEPCNESNEATNTGVVGILLAEQVRGRGWAAKVLKAGIARIWWLTNWNQIRAQIKPNNTASIRAFTQAGFERIPSVIDSINSTAQEQSEIPIMLLISRPERIPFYHAD